MSECFGQLDEAKLQSRTRLLAAEEAALGSKQRADALHDERGTLRRKLEEATRELELRTQRSSEQEHTRLGLGLGFGLALALTRTPTRARTLTLPLSRSTSGGTTRSRPPNTRPSSR